MNENIDLTKILKNCPSGTKFYTTVWGDVEFRYLNENADYPICIKSYSDTHILTKNGKWFDSTDTECIIFPSRQQRDWSKFTAPWYKKENNTIEKSQTNERTWLYLVSDVLTWKDGIGQYLDNPEVQEIAKRLCNKYAQKLYNPSVLSNSSDTRKNERKFDPKTLQAFDKVLVFDSDRPWAPLLFSYLEYSLNYPRMQCFDFAARKVIPYNKETEHLVGTYDEAPEYYRYWED